MLIPIIQIFAGETQSKGRQDDKNGNKQKPDQYLTHPWIRFIRPGSREHHQYANDSKNDGWIYEYLCGYFLHGFIYLQI